MNSAVSSRELQPSAMPMRAMTSRASAPMSMM